MPLRKIIHVDINAFCPSFERRDSPSLRSRPLGGGHGATRAAVCAP
jgi:DNA polymerase-4